MSFGTITGVSLTSDAARQMGIVSVTGNVSIGNFPATQAVTGTFWQATQPVSGTFFQATQPVSIAATVAVSGPLTDAQLRATPLPISQSTLPAGTNNIGDVDVLTLPPLPAGTNNIGFVTDKTAALLAVVNTGASGAAVTLTLPAPAAGLFHYITSLELTLYSAAARTGAAAPAIVTSTNLPGSPSWNFSTAGAIGTIDRVLFVPSDPFRSSLAATATTIVAPITAGGLWKLQATYYTAT